MRMFAYIGVFMVLVFWFFQSYSYELTEKDNNLLDVFEEKLFDIIDERDSVTPEKVEWLLEQILTKKLSDRTRTLVEVILDDLQYVYYLGEYGDVVYTAEDCYDDEYFDEVDQRCYFDDENYDYDDEENYYVDEEEWHSHDDYEWDEVLAEYLISWDSISLVSGESEQRHLDVWEGFTQIIPAHVRKDFKKFKIVDSADSDTGAHVEQDEEDNMKWNMTVNLDAFYQDGEALEEYGLSTLIHEFAHVLTLNKTQVRYYPVYGDDAIFDRFAENCQTNLLQEGCLEEDAYLDDFIDKFWSDEDELMKVREEGLDVYTGNEDSFITDYAATNPWEDIAESFTYFVLHAKPTWGTIADQKLLFFYDYKELENLRKQIRTRIANTSE